MKRLLTLIGVPLFIGFTALGVNNITHQQQVNDKLDIQLNQKEIRLNNLQQKMLELDKQLDEHKGKSEQDQQKIQQLEQEKQQLEKDLQAKLERKEAERIAHANLQRATTRASGTGVASASGNCGDNQYKQFIYMKESGCRTNAINSIGCRGIGQACPGSKLPCGDDFACQDAWFSNYAIQRYGSWERAYNFWVQNRWW